MQTKECKNRRETFILSCRQSILILNMLQAKIVAANGDMEKAEEMLTKALVNKENDIDVLMTLGKVKSNLKKHKEVRELLTISPIQVSISGFHKFCFKDLRNVNVIPFWV